MRRLRGASLILLSILLAFLAAAPVARAAIASAAATATESAVGIGVSTRTFNVTVPAGDSRLLVCGTGARDATTTTLPVASVTFNGVALTKHREDIVTIPGGPETLASSLWQLVAPPVGTFSVVVTWSGAVANYATAWCLPLTGVHQTTPIAAVAGSTAGVDTTPLTGSITPTADQSWVIDAIVSAADFGHTVGAGQTSRSNRIVTGGASTDTVGGSTKGPISPAALTTMSWTPSPSTKFAMSMIALNAAGVGVGVGPSFAGTCNMIDWNANTDLDLAGYRLYDRVDPSAPYTLLTTVGLQITSTSCAPFNFNPGQHYVSLTSLDVSGNESAHTADTPFYLTANTPVNDLRVTAIGATDQTLTWTEVDGGTGLPASYEVRVATPTITWGTAASVTSGTCSTPVAGTTIGASKSCTVTSLSMTTPYQFQLIPFRGTQGVGAVYGPLSNIASGTTGGSPPGATTRTVCFSDGFDRADGALGANWDDGYFDVARSRAVASLQIVSNAVRNTVANSFNDAGETVNANGCVFARDQWASATIKTITNSGGNRIYGWITLGGADPTTQTLYRASVVNNGYSGETTVIGKIIDGAITTLVSESATTWAATDVVLFEKVWNATTLTNDLKVYRNGSGTPLLSTTDASITSNGRPGLGSFLNSGTPLGNLEFDNFQAGGFTTTAAADPCGCDNH